MGLAHRRPSEDRIERSNDVWFYRGLFSRTMSRRYAARAVLAACLAACSTTDSATAPPATQAAGGSAGVAGAGGAGGSAGWQPGVVKPSTPSAGPRGLLDVRGLIHAHSVYSHDACDNAPRDPITDAIDESCLDDFRRDLCHVGHDFVMLTDHNESFGRSEFPAVLLYRPASGDALLERGGKPVANRLACPGGGAPLILGGTESATIAAGLEGHVPGSIDERQAVYGSTSSDAIGKIKAAGAVSLLMHTEDWTLEELLGMPVDGFEMYNLHADLKSNYGPALELLVKVNTRKDELPHPDLVLLPLFVEDPVYLSKWGTVLASGARRVTTMGTDCHRNSFPALLPDGERIDSYRRMMQWFSNHVLVRPDANGAWDDRSLKDALRSARLYGAFEVFGYPRGFDYHATEGDTVREMGDEASLSKGAKLHVASPTIDDLDPGAERPLLTTRILRAKDGGWDVVAEGTGPIVFTPSTPGAYRAEVRITPRHLRAHLSTYAAEADRDFPFVYANAIHVVP